MSRITVDLGRRSYDVIVGSGQLSEIGPATSALGDVQNVAVISDSNVSKLYGQKVLDSLRRAGLSAAMLVFPAGEANKNLATYGRLMDELLALPGPIERSSLIVALGGGVVGDVAGFVAATALRGLRWLQCPTTLLADVDASVGGKTAVDHTTGKNLIGAFHQPAGVLIDVECLGTLSAQELRNGLAECVKHAVIRDADMLKFIEEHVDEILTCRSDVMTKLITRNVAIKAGVVAADEREAGERAELNFGHTIGHAIEVLVGYDKMPHGPAVALGMLAACRIAQQRGLIDEAMTGRISAILERLALPVRCKQLAPEQVWQTMQHDKKARGGKVRMILPQAVGSAGIYDDITPQEVAEAMTALT